MSTLSLERETRRAPWPYVVALGLTVWFSGLGGSGGGDADGYGASEGGGCNGSHAILGTVAVGGIGARGCSRLARNSDVVVDGGRGLMRGGGELAGAGARNLDGAVTAFTRSDAAWNDVVSAVGEQAARTGEVPTSVLALHPELAGKLTDPAALRAYADRDPSFYVDVSVGVYLENPTAFQRLGTDALTAGAAVSTPGFRAALKRAAGDRMRTALREMQAAERAAWADIARRNGLRYEPRPGGRFGLALRTSDYQLKLHEVTLDAGLEAAELLVEQGLELEPTSNRARFDDALAIAAIETHTGQSARPFRMRDVGPLAAYRTRDQWVLVSPDLDVFELGDESGLQALFAAVGAGDADSGVPAEVVVGVWALHADRPFVPPEPPGGWRVRPHPTSAQTPARAPQDDGVRYRFHWGELTGAGPLEPAALLVHPDGSFVSLDAPDGP